MIASLVNSILNWGQEPETVRPSPPLLNDLWKHIFHFLPSEDLYSCYRTSGRFFHLIKSDQTLLNRLPLLFFRPLTSRIECPPDIPKYASLALYCARKSEGIKQCYFILKIAKKLNNRALFLEALHLFNQCDLANKKLAIFSLENFIENIAFFDEILALNMVESHEGSLEQKMNAYCRLAIFSKNLQEVCRLRVVQNINMDNFRMLGDSIKLQYVLAFGNLEVALLIIDKTKKVEGLLAVINNNDQLTDEQKLEIFTEQLIPNLSFHGLTKEVVMKGIQLKFPGIEWCIIQYINSAPFIDSVGLLREFYTKKEMLPPQTLDNHLEKLIIVARDFVVLNPLLVGDKMLFFAFNDFLDLCKAAGKKEYFLKFFKSLAEIFKKEGKIPMYSILAYAIYPFDPEYALEFAHNAIASVEGSGYCDNVYACLKIHFPELTYPIFLKKLEQNKKAKLLWENIYDDSALYIDKDEKVCEKLYESLFQSLKDRGHFFNVGDFFLRFAKSIYFLKPELSQTAFVKVMHLFNRFVSDEEMSECSKLVLILSEFFPKEAAGFLQRKNKRNWDCKDFVLMLKNFKDESLKLDILEDRILKTVNEKNNFEFMCEAIIDRKFE